MPFVKVADIPVKHPGPGWDSRYFHSEHVTFAYTDIAAGADVHPHQHEQEEIFYLIEGELEVRIGDDVAHVRGGEVARRGDHDLDGVRPAPGGKRRGRHLRQVDQNKRGDRARVTGRGKSSHPQGRGLDLEGVAKGVHGRRTPYGR